MESREAKDRAHNKVARQRNSKKTRKGKQMNSQHTVETYLGIFCAQTVQPLNPLRCKSIESPII